MKNQQGVTVFIALLILSSMVVLAMAISDLVLRTSQSSKKIGLSEIAYHAAETCVEEALYQIEKTFDVTGLDGSTGSLDEISDATWSLSLEPVYLDSPYEITLDVGETYQLELNFQDDDDDLNYPNSITFNWTGGPTRAKGVTLANDGTQESHTTPFSINNLPTDLYIVRVDNIWTSAITINLLAGVSENTPIGITLTCTGEYKGQRRILDVQRTNWQIF
ncbi:MAG: hypothetical protein ABIA91_03460 [Patescibacteria group bacterium]